MGKRQNAKPQRQAGSEQFTINEARRLCNEVRLDILEAIGTTYALACAIALRNKEYDELYSLIKRDPLEQSWITTVNSMLHIIAVGSQITSSGSVFRSEWVRHYKAGAMVKALFSKNDDLPDLTSVDGEQFSVDEHTYDLYFSRERANAVVNKRFASYQEKLAPFEGNSFLNDVRDEVARVLGPGPSIEDAKIIFSNGANSEVNSSTKSSLSIQEKIRSGLPKLSSTLEAAYWFAAPMLTLYKVFYAAPARDLTGHSFTLLVPKKFDEKRVIQRGQSALVPLQLWLGKILARRLKQATGINLSSQADHHRYLVKQHWDIIATIDVRTASLSLCEEVIRYLVPGEWYEWMDLVREKRTLLGNLSLKTEFFSAMGNGYTFELETIIFYAICKCALKKSNNSLRCFSVFGDDIIVPIRGFAPVVDALKFFGFEINISKSFGSGPFKESCGMDTLFGLDVRPVFFRKMCPTVVRLGKKKILSMDRQAQKVKLANFVLQVCAYLESPLYGGFKRAWLRCTTDKMFSSDRHETSYRLPMNFGGKVVPGFYKQVTHRSFIQEYKTSTDSGSPGDPSDELLCYMASLYSGEYVPREVALPYAPQISVKHKGHFTRLAWVDVLYC